MITVTLLHPVPATELQAGANDAALSQNPIWRRAVNECLRKLIDGAAPSCARGVNAFAAGLAHKERYGLSAAERAVIAGLLGAGTANEVTDVNGFFALSTAARAALQELATDVAAAIAMDAYWTKGAALKSPRARRNWARLASVASSVNTGKLNYARASYSWNKAA